MCAHEHVCASASARRRGTQKLTSKDRVWWYARRAVAHEYGLQLSQLKPRQAFLSRIATKADEDRQSVHCDESSFAAYHYSSVLYLTSQGAEFEGGGFSFVDPPSNPHPAGQLRDVVPRACAALTFSSESGR